MHLLLFVFYFQHYKYASFIFPFLILIFFFFLFWTPTYQRWNFSYVANYNMYFLWIITNIEIVKHKDLFFQNENFLFFVFVLSTRKINIEHSNLKILRIQLK